MRRLKDSENAWDEMSEIKNCPFCNGIGEVEKIRGDHQGPEYFYVHCKECHGQGPFFFMYKDGSVEEEVKHKAITAWNRRIDEGRTKE